jgi:predicted RNA methylase
MKMAPWPPPLPRPIPPAARVRPRLLDVEAVHLHGVMLDDRGRTASFIEALRATIRPGDVVVDVGTGIGVVAVAAAQAGARHVYATNQATWRAGLDA